MLASGSVYRMPAGEGLEAATGLSLRVNGQGRYVLVRIYNADDAPLKYSGMKVRRLQEYVSVSPRSRRGRIRCSLAMPRRHGRSCWRGLYGAVALGGGDGGGVGGSGTESAVCGANESGAVERAACGDAAGRRSAVVLGVLTALVLRRGRRRRWAGMRGKHRRGILWRGLAGATARGMLGGHSGRALRSKVFKSAAEHGTRREYLTVVSQFVREGPEFRLRGFAEQTTWGCV